MLCHSVFSMNCVCVVGGGGGNFGDFPRVGETATVAPGIYLKFFHTNARYQNTCSFYEFSKIYCLFMRLLTLLTFDIHISYFIVKIVFREFVKSRSSDL